MKKNAARNKGSARSIKGEWSDTKDYEFHPLAERFPLMNGDEFEQHADDIMANGQKETVNLYDGKILDGRNRYRACKARGKPCRFEQWDGKGDPWDYVLSMNLHRRHLTAEARKALVIELRKESKSIRQIAETIHSSTGSVHRDLEKATVPDGTVAADNLPTTIKGKDGKERRARTPNSAKNGNRKDRHKTTSAAGKPDAPKKGERPTIEELIQIISRGLDKTGEVESIKTSKKVLSFKFNGYTANITCKITG